MKPSFVLREQYGQLCSLGHLTTNSCGIVRIWFQVLAVRHNFPSQLDHLRPYCIFCLDSWPDLVTLLKMPLGSVSFITFSADFWCCLEVGLRSAHWLMLRCIVMRPSTHECWLIWGYWSKAAPAAVNEVKPQIDFGQGLGLNPVSLFYNLVKQQPFKNTKEQSEKKKMVTMNCGSPLTPVI